MSLTIERFPADLALEIQIAEPVMTAFRPSGSKVEFFEHPRYGDDSPTIALEGGIFSFTDVWDLATARLYCGHDA